MEGRKRGFKSPNLQNWNKTILKSHTEILKNPSYFIFKSFYLPLGWFMNGLVCPSHPFCLFLNIQNSLRIYWYWVIRCPGDMVLVVQSRSRSQGSTEQSNYNIWHFFANSFQRFHPIIIKIGAVVPSEPKKKRNKPEFWFFNSVDFFGGRTLKISEK